MEIYMRLITRTRCLAFGMIGLLTMSAIGLSGCNSKTTSDGGAKATTASDVDHSHGGWWCVEHGVPESECARCDSSLVAKFKAAGDWCKEHDRPESQCFLCGPKRFEKFAATYEAKTGHKPPKPAE
jgi:hypothetical protein